MAFENFPSAETPPPCSATEQIGLAYLSLHWLVIALLGTWGYIIWDKSKTKEAFLQKDTQYAAVASEKDTLQSLLDEATSRYDMLKTTNAKKDSSITVKDREISEKKARIQSLISKANATKKNWRKRND